MTLYYTERGEIEFCVTIVRHGQTEANVLKIIQGHSNTPLTELGIKQAQALGNYFSRKASFKGFNAIYSSDLNRALQTCKLILDCSKNPIENLNDEPLNSNHEEEYSKICSDTRLRERGYGPFEGHSIGRLHEAAFKFGYDLKNFTRYVPDGGESMNQVRHRMAGFFFGILCQKAQPGDEILVVTHWATIKEFLKLIKPNVRPRDSLTCEHMIETPNTAFSRFKIRCNPSSLFHELGAKLSDFGSGQRNLSEVNSGQDEEGNYLGSEEELQLIYSHLMSRFTVQVVSLHQTPHLSSEETSVNLRQQMD